MISERQFNDVLKEINTAFSAMSKRVSSLEKKIKEYADEANKEKLSAGKKTRPKTS